MSRLGRAVPPSTQILMAPLGVLDDRFGSGTLDGGGLWSWTALTNRFGSGVLNGGGTMAASSLPGRIGSGILSGGGTWTGTGFGTGIAVNTGEPGSSGSIGGGPGARAEVSIE